MLTVFCSSLPQSVGGYHGRTFGAMAVTRSKTIYSEGFAPLMVGLFADRA